MDHAKEKTAAKAVSTGVKVATAAACAKAGATAGACACGPVGALVGGAMAWLAGKAVEEILTDDKPNR